VSGPHSAPTATSLLPLERISKFFLLFTHQHPSWLYECKSHRINKIKGRLGFPLKTKSPSGATAGASLPKNWSHFSHKTHRKCAKYASTQILGEPTQDASGQKAKKRESGIAYASGRIWPFPLTTSPTSYSCERTFPGQGSPKKIGRQNNTIAGVNNDYFKLQAFKCFKP
jgi:hypothetical protein